MILVDITFIIYRVKFSAMDLHELGADDVAIAVRGFFAAGDGAFDSQDAGAEVDVEHENLELHQRVWGDETDSGARDVFDGGGEGEESFTLDVCGEFFGRDAREGAAILGEGFTAADRL